MKVGELLVRLGFELNPEDQRNLKLYNDKIDQLGKKLQNFVSEQGARTKGMFSELINVPNIITGALGSAYGVGITNNEKLEKSYRWLFSSILKHAKNTVKPLAKALNLSKDQIMELRYTLFQHPSLPSTQKMGGTLGKFQYVDKLLTYARSYQQANPLVTMDQALEKILGFLAPGDDWEFAKELSKQVKDPKKLAKLAELQRLGVQEYAQTGGGFKQKRGALDALFSTIPKYNAQQDDLLTNLQRIDTTFKEIVRVAQERLTPAFKMFASKLARIHKTIGLTEDEFKELGGTITAITTSFGGMLVLLRIAAMAINWLTFGLAGKLAGGVLKGGGAGVKGGLAGLGTLAAKILRNPVAKGGAYTAAAVGLYELAKMIWGDEAVEAGMEGLDKFLEEKLGKAYTLPKAAYKKGRELTKPVTDKVGETIGDLTYDAVQAVKPTASKAWEKTKEYGKKGVDWTKKKAQEKIEQGIKDFEAKSQAAKTQVYGTQQPKKQPIPLTPYYENKNMMPPQIPFAPQKQQMHPQKPTSVIQNNAVQKMEININGAGDPKAVGAEVEMRVKEFYDKQGRRLAAQPRSPRDL